MHDLSQFGEYLDMLPEAMLVADTSGKVLAVNAAASRMLEPLDLHIGRTSLMELCSNGAGNLPQYLLACSRTSSFIPAAVTFAPPLNMACRVEGAVLNRKERAEPARILLRLTPKERAVSRFVELNVQLARLSREIMLRTRTEEELARQQEFLQATLGCIADAVIAFDTNGIIILFNAAAERQTGWTVREAIGMPVGQLLQIIDEQTRQPIENFLMLRHAIRNSNHPSRHPMLIRRDGREIFVSESVAPIRDAKGSIIGTVLVLQDITERRQLQQKIEKDNQDLEEANRRKDEFLAMLGHELRNPLAPIKTATDLLLLSVSANSMQHRAIAIIERQLSHLVGLVDQILDIARISTGRIALQTTLVDIQTVVQCAVELCASSIEAKRQQLRVELPDTQLMVRGDMQRLTQIIGNLVNNASKYNTVGGSIWVTVETLGDQVQITVRDNGMGIAPDVMPHIFDLFYQSERTLDRSYGGLGLGLTLVKKLTEQHGGSISAFSEGVGKGSRFRLRIPRAAASFDMHMQAPPMQAAQKNGVGSFRVLVVDDNLDAATTLQEMLAILGHTVRTAANGDEAIAAAAEQIPHIVFLDIGLPGKNGFDVARILRSMPELQKTVLVALTGYGQHGDRQHSKEAGFDYHLVKPASLDTICAIVDSLDG